MSELEMHHGEAVAWIRELEAFIRENGLQVPTWADREKAGLQPKPEQVWPIPEDTGPAKGAVRRADGRIEVVRRHE